MFVSTRTFRRRHAVGQLLSLTFTLLGAVCLRAAEPARLLFHISGENGVTAQSAAAGSAEPTFATEVTTIDDGAIGHAIQCGDRQRLAWKAPGNIYAQRGTLSFFWRARYPVGPTEFPLFRVGYGDHSSWDMVWLRIDYNGHGFDAFVTDASLARVRVSVAVTPFPTADKWIHLALSWDESSGVRLYVDGHLVAENRQSVRYDAALDQFGPHSRVISPYQVQSDYNFTRGGDVDELRIYDRMLSDEAVAQLAQVKTYSQTQDTAPAMEMNRAARFSSFLFRHGWETPAPPPQLARFASVRKVEIHDAYDLKRWWWKATDGIRETTWPGVYNQSRLPGRDDYFKLPDWDCYSLSGKAITFTLPDEEWNHVEIAGAAFGELSTLVSPESADPQKAGWATVARRPEHEERTVHSLSAPRRGGKLRFTNEQQETPIGELTVYHVAQTPEPDGVRRVACRFDPPGATLSASVSELADFIRGRHPQGERVVRVARAGVPAVSSAEKSSRGSDLLPPVAPSGSEELPLVHFVIPAELNGESLARADEGLDGIGLDIPALKLAPTHGDVIALNIQVKDPLWPMRNLLDFTFSVRAGVKTKLWLDLRDRVLPPGKAVYFTLASASREFGAAQVAELEARLVFKSKDAAKAEHVSDRFTQLRDSYAMLVEEHPRGAKFSLWRRFKGDLEDLLRVDPQHELALAYAATAMPEQYVWKKLLQAAPASNVPTWAARQVELLRALERFVMFYIDQRQIDNGELGGGLSDDTDLLNHWAGAALMGIEPEKVRRSARRLLDACYAHGMFTRGLSTIQTDELHSYEEGINALGQMLLLDYGSPRQLERAMETARGTEWITGINSAGHRHIRSSYFSGSRVAEEEPWGTSKAYSYLILHPTQMLAEFNGSPRAKTLLEELARGLLEHRVVDQRGQASLHDMVHFATDKAQRSVRPYLPWPLFWTVWKETGNRGFLQPIFDRGAVGIFGVNANALDELRLRETWGDRIVREADRLASGMDSEPRADRGAAREYRAAVLHLAWQITGKVAYLETLYAEQVAEAARLEYINTQGSLWIDRVGLPTSELQRARLGGVALTRNNTAPGHVVSWTFAAPARADDVAILIPDATRRGFHVNVYNLSVAPVSAALAGGEIDPGEWEIVQGIDTDGDGEPDVGTTTRNFVFERGLKTDLTFAPSAATVLRLRLIKAATPYAERCDLGIDREDVSVDRQMVTVRVHNVGSISISGFRVAVVDRNGAVLGVADVGALEAPLDLQAKTAQAEIHFKAGQSLDGCSVILDPENRLVEITRVNNSVRL
jgi:Concanavalin A-like lectin/glucanases superfamily